MESRALLARTKPTKTLGLVIFVGFIAIAGAILWMVQGRNNEGSQAGSLELDGLRVKVFAVDFELTSLNSDQCENTNSKCWGTNINVSDSTLALMQALGANEYVTELVSCTQSPKGSQSCLIAASKSKKEYVINVSSKSDSLSSRNWKSRVEVERG